MSDRGFLTSSLETLSTQLWSSSKILSQRAPAVSLDYQRAFSSGSVETGYHRLPHFHCLRPSHHSILLCPEMTWARHCRFHASGHSCDSLAAWRTFGRGVGSEAEVAKVSASSSFLLCYVCHSCSVSSFF